MLGDGAREELLARMSALIARRGAQTYLTAPLLEPNDRCFPDPYSSDLAGLRTVARRLLRYAGLEGLAVDMYGAERASDDPLAQTSVVLTHVDERSLELGVWGIGEPEEVPLVLAHEVARAYHELGRSVGRSDGPYRSVVLDVDAEEEPDDEHEEEVSLTACYLGFGLLVALGSHRYKAHGEIAGYTAITRWVHRRLGALTPDEAAFLLAAHAVVREVDEATLEDWRGRLSVNVRKDFARYLEDLGEDRDGLVEALGLPEPPWPEPAELDPAPLEDDGWEPAAPDDAPIEHPVFRFPQNAGWSLAVAGGVASLVGLFVVLAEDPALVWGVLVGGPLLSFVAYFGGKQIHRGDECTGCGSKLGADDVRCAKCGGTIVGALRENESHLEALERAGVRTTHDGLLAEEQTDADPRYTIRGVKCPTCAWIPDGEPHWDCEECDGEPFNTFEHGGECPHCNHVFEETWCPKCDHSNPYDWWWPAD